ncbi:hypothetical protein K435DRAFT_855147 [Dendrothele bispora CBS 962.96]|uniref:Uncharacterized protein n=1 Tax=Dendrothele bispora (strain CBS 962.96) TaxID=1314807 RepID=A0A4S8MDE7_DENBC|nr:hypothetical protein K435DRAFT_855147 [Dendrothele bispora CBS 962.96]
MTLTTVPFDVLGHISSFLDDMVDVANLANITRHSDLPMCSLLPSIKSVLSLFVPCPLALLDKMELTGCVVTGSSAVWAGLLFPVNEAAPVRGRCTWLPRSLDMLVDNRHVEDMCLYFLKIGYVRKRVYVVDQPWKQSSSMVTELHHTRGSVRKCVSIIHLKPLACALYIHLVSSPTTLDMIAFSSTTWLCFYPRLFQRRMVWFRQFEYSTRHTDNIRWGRLKRYGFQPLATNRMWTTACSFCPSLWRTLADRDSLSSCYFRNPRSGKEDVLLRDTRRRFQSTADCSLAWQFSENCLNVRCSHYTTPTPAPLQINIGLHAMGVPRLREPLLLCSAENHIDGILFDVRTRSFTVVSIPFLNKSSSSKSLDDLALNAFLDDIPHAVYSPARYRFCVFNDVTRNVRMTIFAAGTEVGAAGRMLVVKQLMIPSTLVPCTENDARIHRVAVASLVNRMGTLGTVAIDAVALAVLRLHTLGPNSHLHLVCSLIDLDSWASFAMGLGWVCIGDEGSDSFRMNRFVTTKNTVVVFTAVDNVSPVQYVTDAPESALITFVGGDGVFCGYPSLTLNNVTFPLQEVELGFRIGWDCLSTFRYDDLFLQSRIKCSACKRSWSDNQSFSFLWSGDRTAPDEDATWTVSVLKPLGACVNVSTLYLRESTITAPIAPHVAVSRLDKSIKHLSSNTFGRPEMFFRSSSFPSSGISPAQTNPPVSFHPTLYELRNSGLVASLHAQSVNLGSWIPSTALATFLSAAFVGIAYPRLTLNHTTYNLLTSHNGRTIGGECLTDFVPVFFADDMPKDYTSARKWGDRLCLLFTWNDDAHRLGELRVEDD